MLRRIRNALVLTMILAGTAAAAEPKALTFAALDTWLERYGAAWDARDATAAGRLFAVDARYHEMPFDAPKQGRADIEEYWRTATADQLELHFDFKVIAVQGNTGVARWSAQVRLRSTGAIVAMDGVFVLEFDAAGQCSTLREWWHIRDT